MTYVFGFLVYVGTYTAIAHVFTSSSELLTTPCAFRMFQSPVCKQINVDNEI